MFFSTSISQGYFGDVLRVPSSAFGPPWGLFFDAFSLLFDFSRRVLLGRDYFVRDLFMHGFPLWTLKLDIKVRH